jgi:DNA (cytosine-5)-methyltransferase 1
MNDPYHLPKPMSQPKPAYDPNSFLKGCITTGGTDAYHPSGKRRFTPRELSLFQSFKYTYHFAGTKSDATTQIGNAFPPVMAEKVYRTIAKTLEAFDTGLIGAEDDLSILDLDALLERNGSRTPQARSAPSSYMDGTSRSRDLPIRSIERNSPSSSRRVSSTSSSSSSGKNRGERSTLSARTERAFPSMDPMGGVLDGISGFGTSARPSASRKPQGSALRNGKREVIEISDDSDEDEQM